MLPVDVLERMPYMPSRCHLISESYVPVRSIILAIVIAVTISSTGCQSSRRTAKANTLPVPIIVDVSPEGNNPEITDELLLTAFEVSDLDSADEPKSEVDHLVLDLPVPERTQLLETSVDDLAALEAYAVAANPSLIKLQRETNAAWAKTRYIDQLPDPKIGANVFASAIETAAGSQRANLTVSQLLPWLPRLDAQAQQACFEAIALQQVYAAQRLKVVGDVRALWYRLYVIGKQIETNEANQKLLESLIDVANARVSTGAATQGDVLIGTLEYSQIEEQLITFRQQQVSAIAEINRLLGRPASTPIHGPNQFNVALPDWNHAMLRQLAWENQPEIAAAQTRTQASRWGIEVAQLKRKPDVALSAAWFAIDNNRPTPSIVDVGRDAWSIGASVSIPLWERKYDAIEQEASWKHSAAQASVEDSRQRYDALLLDLWEKAKAADETVRLYKTTILPQAEETLAADQLSYSTSSVEFDRVIRDFRNLLTLELGYHRAVGQLATALARIKQATGTELSGKPSETPGKIEPVPATDDVQPQQ